MAYLWCELVVRTVGATTQHPRRSQNTAQNGGVQLCYSQAPPPAHHPRAREKRTEKEPLRGLLYHESTIGGIRNPQNTILGFHHQSIKCDMSKHDGNEIPLGPSYLQPICFLAPHFHTCRWTMSDALPSASQSSIAQIHHRQSILV